MTESLLFLSALLLPVAGIISILFLPHSIRAKANFLFVLLVAVITSVPAVKALTGNDIEVVIGKTPVFGNISFHIDSLSAWFILIINLTCINGAFYGIGYMKQYNRAKVKPFFALDIVFTVSIFDAMGLYGAKWVGLFGCLGIDVYLIFSACHI